MEIKAFLEGHFGDVKSNFTFEMLAESKAFAEAAEWTEDKDRAAATLASFVCQAAVVTFTSPFGSRMPPYIGGALSSAEALQVTVSNRFGLLLFLDAQWSRWPMGELWRAPLPFRSWAFYPETSMIWYETVIRTMERDAERLGEERVRQQVGRTARIARRFAEEPTFQECLHELMVLAIPRPLTILTGVPRPAWSVSLTSPWSSGVTVGLLAKNSGSRRGVTTALHGLGNPSPPLGSTVYVDGYPGTLEAIDPISDSCFISIPDSLQPSTSFGAQGVLSGQVPGQGETAVFERVGSGKKTTTIVLVDPFVTIATDLSQKKLYTSADTQLGDSGAALVDRRDSVIGFSLERTGIGAPIEFSAWIWADLAVRRLNITPLP